MKALFDGLFPATCLVLFILIGIWLLWPTWYAITEQKTDAPSVLFCILWGLAQAGILGVLWKAFKPKD